MIKGYRLQVGENAQHTRESVFPTVNAHTNKTEQFLL